MDNDSKHVLAEIKKWYQSCNIEIESGPLHSSDINSIENVWGIIFYRKSSREMNQINVNLLKWLFNIKIV